ncbi:MAG: hypothetical protein R6U59_08915 [Eubacteriales bacterium]|jgi:hypothetical protein
MNLKGQNTLSQKICNLLLVLAPVLAVNMQSTILWGEPDIPDSLES